MNAKELRKKKILENAEARLAKITGSYSATQPGQLPSPSTSAELPIDNLSNQRSEPNIAESFCSLPGASSLDEPLINSRIFEILNNDFFRARETPTTQQRVAKVWQNHFAFAALGLLTRLAFFFGYEGYFGQVILVPFLVVCIPNLIHIVYNSGEPQGGLQAALMIIGVSPKLRRIISSTIFLIRRVFINFAFYMFTFSLSHWLIEQLPAS